MWYVWRRGEVGKPSGKIPVQRPRRRWKDNIKMVLKKWDWGVELIDLAQDRDKWCALVQTGSIKYGEFLY